MSKKTEEKQRLQIDSAESQDVKAGVAKPDFSNVTGGCTSTEATNCNAPSPSESTIVECLK